MMSSNPFVTPEITQTRIADYEGLLLVIVPQRVVDRIATSYGEASAVEVDLTPLEGSDAGKTEYGVRVFQRVLQLQLKDQLGNMVLGRLGRGAPKPGQTAPFQIEPPTEQDQALGLRWYQAQQRKQPKSPFATMTQQQQPQQQAAPAASPPPASFPNFEEAPPF